MIRALASGLLLLAAAAPAAAAQVSANASITATAEVSTTALTATVNRPLDFGFLFPGGGATTIDPQTSTQAAEVEIHGTKRAEITIDFALPANLMRGVDTLPITFGATAACHTDKPPQTACTPYDPTTTLTVRIRNKFFPQNTYWVYLGGTVNPPLAQPAGTYTATATLTTTYTGN